MPFAAAGRYLYRPEDERDACGVGFVADIDGSNEAIVFSKRPFAALPT